MPDERRTVDLLLDAAESLLGRFGYRKMTVDDLARAAGIAKGSVYLHFASKQEIALGTIDRLVHRVVAALEEIASRDLPHDERARQMLVQRVMMRFDAVRGYSESLDDLLADIRPALLERRKGWFRREERVLSALIADGLRSEAFATADPDLAARDLVAATNSLLPLSLTAKELGRRAEIARQAARIADLLVEGLRRRAPEWAHHGSKGN